jgi:hypothetical protein
MFSIRRSAALSAGRSMAVRLQAAGLQQARFLDSKAQDALRNVGNGIALLGVERRGGRLNCGILVVG